MSVVQPGGQKDPVRKSGSGQKPASGQKSGQRPPSSGRRPPSAKPGSGGAQRGAPKSSGGRGPASGARSRTGTPVPSAPPKRFSVSTMAYVAIALVVLVIVALVIVKVIGGSSTTSSSAPTLSPAPASLVSQVTGVPQSVATAVGLPSGVTAPKVLTDQSGLSGTFSSTGKPQALFIGAEFCPLCGAERWAMIMAFSKFGTFSGLQETTSSPWDTPPAIATFSFAKSKYTSSLLDFTTVEHESNDSNGLGTRTVLTPLTQAQQKIWTTVSSHYGLQTGYPFVDFDNKVFVLGPSYSPYVLEGLDQSAIAAKLKNPNDPVTQGIVGTSNYLTAAICSMTGQQPGSVCTAPATVQASKAMGLKS